MTPPAGAESPRGPGWWLASDGKYYPPELASTSRASESSAPKKKVVKKKAAAPKKKVVKKKAAAPRNTSSATGTSTTLNAPKKKVVKKKAAAKTASGSPAESEAPEQPGEQPVHTTEQSPPDQIAARRVQAREQLVLLAGARAEAALRALADMSEEDEPVLVGVGTRSLDARSDRRSTVSPPSPPPVAKAQPPATVTAPPAPPTPPTPPASTPPVVVDRALPDIPTVTPREPARAPAVGTNYEPRVAPTARMEPAATPAPTPTPVGPAQTTRPVPASVAPRPHQPLKGPDPSAAPMGTDVPFMEVKGSALGTDIDRIGEKIMIFADRVELRDRNNTTRQAIRYDELAEVEVQKKIMGPSLVITSVTGTTLAAKALRPELASGAKAMIDKHAERFLRGEGAGARAHAPKPTTPEESPTPAPIAPVAAVVATKPASGAPTHRFVLVAMLEELHEAGILSSEELETKKALIEITDKAT